MTDEFLLDSNILVYAFDTTEGKKHKIAKELLEDAFRGQTFAISIQNLTEFFITATKKVKKPISVEESKEIIQLIVSFKKFTKITPSENTVLKAIDLNMPFWDAMIAATMLENNIHHIYTENTKDFNIPGIEAVNPFA